MLDFIDWFWGGWPAIAVLRLGMCLCTIMLCIIIIYPVLCFIGFLGYEVFRLVRPKPKRSTRTGRGK